VESRLGWACSGSGSEVEVEVEVEGRGERVGESLWWEEMVE
jgi:hypothetical protein